MGLREVAEKESRLNGTIVTNGSKPRRPYKKDEKRSGHRLCIQERALVSNFWCTS